MSWPLLRGLPASPSTPQSSGTTFSLRRHHHIVRSQWRVHLLSRKWPCNSPTYVYVYIYIYMHVCNIHCIVNICICMHIYKYICSIICMHDDADPQIPYTYDVMCKVIIYVCGSLLPPRNTIPPSAPMVWAGGWLTSGLVCCLSLGDNFFLGGGHKLLLEPGLLFLKHICSSSSSFVDVSFTLSPCLCL